MTIETDMESTIEDEMTSPFGVVDDSIVDLETVTDIEPLAGPEIKPKEQRKRGECCIVGCGNKAVNGRSMYCETHFEYSPSYGKTTVLKPPGERSEIDILQGRIKGEVKKVKKFILDHNNDIVRGQQMLAGIPDPFMDGPKDSNGVCFEITLVDGTKKKLWEPSIRNQLAVTEREAEAFANAVVQFEHSKQGEQVGALATSLMPWANLIVAGGFLVMRSMKLNALKSDIAQIKAMMEQQAEKPIEATEPANQNEPLSEMPFSEAM